MHGQTVNQNHSGQNLVKKTNSSTGVQNPGHNLSTTNLKGGKNDSGMLAQTPSNRPSQPGSQGKSRNTGAGVTVPSLSVKSSNMAGAYKTTNQIY